METLGILERIEFKLNAILTAINSGVTSTIVIGDVAKTMTETPSESTSTVELGADVVTVASSGQWDFTKLDKEGLPADDRIHGKVTLDDGVSKGFNMANSGLWQKRRGLKPDVKAAVMVELLALVADWEGGIVPIGIVTRAAQAATQAADAPPPPPPINTGNTPPPPPPIKTDDAPPPPPPPPAGTTAAELTNFITNFMKETGIKGALVMHYLSDTYGFASFDDITEPSDRDGMMGDLDTWKANFNLAQAELNKIIAIYVGYEDTIKPCLVKLIESNYDYSNNGTTFKSQAITEIQYDKITESVAVFAEYYASINQG